MSVCKVCYSYIQEDIKEEEHVIPVQANPKLLVDTHFNESNLQYVNRKPHCTDSSSIFSCGFGFCLY